MAAKNCYSFRENDDPDNTSYVQDNVYEMSPVEYGGDSTYANVGFQQAPQSRPVKERTQSQPVTERFRPSKAVMILSIFLALSLAVGVTCMALLFMGQTEVKTELIALETRHNQTLTQGIDNLKSVQVSSANAQRNAMSKAQDDFQRALMGIQGNISAMGEKIQKNENDTKQTRDLISKETIDRINETEKLAHNIGILNSSVARNKERIGQIPSFVRLNGTGASHLQGRVEILHNGIWGTICDDNWDLNDAHVICRMLGFSRATAAPAKARYGQGSVQIWLDDVACSGSEFWIDACPKRPWGVHNCGHHEDASVVCA